MLRMVTPRQKVKQDMRPPVDRQAKGLRGGGYDGPRINGDRSDIHQVQAYDPGYKGAKKPKLRPKWPY